MIASSFRGLMIASLAGGALLTTPSPSHAILHWFCPNSKNWFAQTTYAPPYSASYAARGFARPGLMPVAYPAATCATCAYVPQTSYRPVYAAVPVTTCMPATSCDPCSGCATTTYRPVTTFVQQVRMVPYTTYRPVYVAPLVSCAPACVSSCAPACAPSCGPCGSYGGCGVSTVTGPSGCSTCAAAPSSAGPLAPTPSYGPSPTDTTPRTFAPGPAPATKAPADAAAAPPSLPASPATQTPTATPDVRLRPTPDNQGSSGPVNTIPLPQLNSADNHTTAAPTARPSFVLISTAPKVTANSAIPLEDGDWRPARK